MKTDAERFFELNAAAGIVIVPSFASVEMVGIVTLVLNFSPIASTLGQPMTTQLESERLSE